MSRLEVVCLASCPMLRASLRQILSHTRWNVHHCSDLDEALRELKVHPRAVFLVESRTACALPQHHKTLVLTEHDEPCAQWLDAGAFDVLPRPLRADDVLELVSSAWQLAKPRSAAAASV